MRRTARVLLLAASLAATGCNTLLWEMGLPWVHAEFVVDRVEVRGPFLDVRVSSDGIRRRYFTRDTPDCRSVLRTASRVTLGRTDAIGPFERGDLVCRVVGIGNLEQLRASRSRGTGYGGSPFRRGNDRIEIVHEDGQYLYARGGFSIGAMFGWGPGTDQVVALLPRVEACEPLAKGGFVTEVYRQVGSPALGIAVRGGVCPIEALIAVEPDDFLPAKR